MSKIRQGISYIGSNYITSAATTTIVDYVTKTIEIGNWDMISTGNTSIPHSLSSTEWKTVTDIFGVIIDDAQTTHYLTNDGVINITPFSDINILVTDTYVYIYRYLSGTFNNSNFNDGAINRGFVSFMYKPD